MGKAYRLPTASDRLRKNSLDLKRLEAFNRLLNTPRPVLASRFSGSSAAGSTGGGTGNFLPTIGGVMNGNIAFDPDLIIVNDGRVKLDPGGNPPKNSTYILVTGQGTPDDIKFIDGAERNGQLLFYQSTNQQIQNIINANILSINGIVGNGSTTVTVTLSDTGTLANGSSINMIGTDNFDIEGGIVAGLVANTSFTYQRVAGASTTPETGATIQDGNILTGDGNTLILDSTLTATNVAVMGLIFDITVGGGGAWRVMFSSVVGSVDTASSAILGLTSNQGSAGVVAWNSNTIAGTGITDEGGGVFKLSGKVFSLESHIRTTSSGGTGTIDIQWQTATDSIFTTPVNVGTQGTVFPASQTSNLSSMPYCSATVDATSTDVFVRLFSDNNTAFTNILSASSVGMISSGGGGGGGSGGISFPVDFPEETDRGTVTTNQVINFADSTRHSIAMTVGTTTITLDLTNPPTNKLALSSITMKQDSTAGRTFSFIPTVGNALTITDAFAALSGNESITFMIEFERGSFTAYLKTGNVVSGGGGSSSLGGLSDVTLTSPINNNFLAFDTTSSLWINQTASQAGVAQGNLGNLANTVVNAVILPATTDVTDFGSELKAWRIIHARDYEITTPSTVPSSSTDTQISKQVTGTAGNEINIFHFNTKTFPSSSVKADYRWSIDGVVAARLSKSGSNLVTFDVDVLEADEQLKLQTQTVNPAIDGVMSNVNGDVKVFSGGALKNLSNIGAGSPLTTKGDIFTYDTNNQRLPIGSANQILSVDLTEATGLKWIVAPVSGANTQLSNLGTTSINANLTPQSGLLLGSDGVPWNRIIGNKINLGTAGTFAASDNAIIADTALGMEYHTPSADFHSFYFNLIKRLEIGTSVLKFVSGGTMQAQIFQLSGDSTVDPVVLGGFLINGSDVSLFAPNFKLTNTASGNTTATFISYRNFAVNTNDELGSIRFDGGTSPTQYARILAGVGEATDSGLLALQVRANNSALQTGVLFKGDDDNTNTYITINSRINSDLKFGVENADPGAFKISPVLGSTKLGLVVQDNVSFTVGTLGTNAIPVTTTAPGTAAIADTRFGNHIGALGIQDTGSSSIFLFERQTDGKWSAVAMARDTLI